MPRSIGFVFICLFFFSSCSKDMSFPVYFQVDSTFLTTNYSTEGTASSNITDVWVVVNGKNIGVYELPATIPVLASGDTKIQFMAGIKKNGLSTQRPYYPFYTSSTYNMNLKSTEIYKFTPKFEYESNTYFAFREDFEDAGIKFTPVDSSVALSKTSDKSLIFSYPGETNHYSGIIALKPNQTFFEIMTGVSIEKNPRGHNTTYCFMEMNYNITHNIEVGFYYHYAGRNIQYPVCGIYGSTERGKGGWKKIYINFTEAFNSSNNIRDLEVYIKGIKNLSDTATYLFDNIKIIYI